MLAYLYYEIGTSPTENILIFTLDYIYTYTYIWQDISYQYVNFDLCIVFIYIDTYLHVSISYVHAPMYI